MSAIDPTLGTIPAGEVVLDEVVAARAPWSAVVAAGEELSIVDLGGNQAVDCILYWPPTPPALQRPRHDRRPGEIFLTTGSVLRSNRGKALMAVVADECGRHDTLGGACSKESNTLRYGHHTTTSTPASRTSSARAPGASASATWSPTSTGT